MVLFAPGEWSSLESGGPEMVSFAPGGAKHDRSGAPLLPGPQGSLLQGEMWGPSQSLGTSSALSVRPFPLLGPLAGHWDLRSTPKRGCLFPALLALLGEKLLRLIQHALLSEALSCSSF